MSASAQSDFIEESIKLGRANLAKDPRTGIFQIVSSQKLIARQALNRGDSEFFMALSNIVKTVLMGFTEYGVPPAPERQIDCIFYAAAANDLHAAKQIAAIGTNYSDSHQFDITLNQLLRAILTPSPRPVSKYRATSSEQALFDSLSSIGTDRFSTDGIDRYWSATRRKRYRLTLYEHRNLLSEAARRIHENI